MKERLLTLLFAIGAGILFFALYVRGERGIDTSRQVPRPTTQERRANGYHAAMAWLDAENIRVVSLREGFDTLSARDDLAASGNILIITLPATTSFKTEEFRPLDRWVREGNTLLVLAALSDTPDWSFVLGDPLSGDLNLLTGLEFETVTTREQRVQRRNKPAPKRSLAPPPDGVPSNDEAMNPLRPLLKPQRAVLVPNRPHAYFTDVREVIAESDYTSRVWTVKVPYQGFVLALARQRETGEGALWTRPLGAGRIVVSGFGSLFTNRALGTADNARLLANIIGANLSREGTVLFDDVHQGVGANYDPDKFYSDRRLYITVGILIGLWLIWVIGSTRLLVPVRQVSAPREAELVKATGGFLARVLRPAAAARRLIEQFFARVNERMPPLSRGSPVPWEYLERQPRVATADLERLKAWYADALAGRRVPLVRLHNLLTQIDRQLA